jgi:acyl-CoA reductase-like NAD-dependent aldehyde dehydrogenase
MGQNCAGPERFIVYEKVYDKFCESVAAVVRKMEQGAPLSSPYIDCGASCMPQAPAAYQKLVDDAVAKGAKVLAGGELPKEGSQGQFYPPTVLADVTPDMRIAKEEIFGPIMCIFKVPNSDAEAVALANNSDFGLSGCAHSASQARAAAICQQMEAGMASVNDLEGTTYLSQSLPFGGVKYSGFDRFAGPEGLRGLCHVKSVVENRLSFLKPSIPAPIAYPSNGQGTDFCLALCQMLYGYGLGMKAMGLLALIKAVIPRKPKKE